MRKNEKKLLTVEEAGRRGGLTTACRYGREFYVTIGRKGQSVMRARYPGMAQIWGRLGGRPTKPSLDEMGREAKN
jgi:general stress protein YciG